MNKLFITDEGRWVTINGRHVFIGENGLQFSKFPTNAKGKFSNYQKEAKEHVDEFGKKSRRLSREDRKSYEQYRKEFDQLNKKEEALNKGKKGLGYTMRLGNAAVRLAMSKNGQKYKLLIKRIGERQNQLAREYSEEHGELDRRAIASTERHQHRVQANANELNKAASEMNAKIKKSARKFEKAKQIRSKAREKINSARETDRFNKAMNLGKYRKPYYETDAFKSGQEERNRGNIYI